MIEVRLDGEEIRDKEQLHRLLAGAFGFPAWYGANLDALYDCLTDISADTRLVISHSDKLAENLGIYKERLFRVLYQASENNPKFTLVCS